MHHSPQRASTRQDLRDFARDARLPCGLELRPKRSHLHRSRSDLDAILYLPEAGAPLDRKAGWSAISHYLLKRKAAASDVSPLLINFRAAESHCSPKQAVTNVLRLVPEYCRGQCPAGGRSRRATGLRAPKPK